MATNGIVGNFGLSGERAKAGGDHGAVLLAGKLAANDGVYPEGLLLSVDVTGALVPFASISDEVLGAGDGNAKTFTATLDAAPVEPGSVVVTAGAETFADDGLGRLTGSAGGSGLIVYATGEIKVTCNAAPAAAASVTADYDRLLVGVLDERVDTSADGSGHYVPHGEVKGHLLKVGKANPVKPTETLLKRLIRKGVYPV